MLLHRSIMAGGWGSNYKFLGNDKRANGWRVTSVGNFGGKFTYWAKRGAAVQTSLIRGGRVSGKPPSNSRNNCHPKKSAPNADGGCFILECASVKPQIDAIRRRWNIVRIRGHSYHFLLNSQKSKRGLLVHAASRHLIDRSTPSYQTLQFLFPYHDRFHLTRMRALALNIESCALICLQIFGLLAQPEKNCISLFCCKKSTSQNTCLARIC